MSDGGKVPAASETAAARPSPWQGLRAATPARIGLGRSGDTMPLAPVLAFQLAHAAARDAVHATLDVEALRAALAPRPTLVVSSAAPDRATYLRRPDLGRTLAPPSEAVLVADDPAMPDCAFVLADGLSAVAVQRHAAALLGVCLPRLDHLVLSPLVIATQARVALGDAIGAALRARVCIVLIGERPGLSVADSLGVYITYAPMIGCRDSQRNCISNIHSSGGLTYAQAASKLCWLVEQALVRKLTGVALKEQAEVSRIA